MNLKFNENRRKILRKFEKKIGERLKKFLGNFTLNMGKVCRKSVEFQNEFRECKVKTIIKSRLNRNHRDQYFEKILQKIWKTATKI